MKIESQIVVLIVAVQLLLGTAMFMSVQVLTVKALVPSIVSVSYHDVGSTTWLDIVVSHLPPPAIDASHYVSVVQLTINGTTVDLLRKLRAQKRLRCSIIWDRTPIHTRLVRGLCALYTDTAHRLTQ